MKTKILTTLAIMAIVPCAVLLTACGSVFGKNDKPADTSTDTAICDREHLDDHVCEDTPCTEQHASDVKYEWTGAGNFTTMSVTQTDVDNTGYSVSKTGAIDISANPIPASAIKNGNAFKANFMVELSNGAKFAMQGISLVSTTGMTGLAGESVYMTETQIGSYISGGMSTNIYARISRTTPSRVDIHMSMSSGRKVIENIKITIDKIVIYGDTAV